MDNLDPRQIYEQNASVAKCIDITAAHTAFGGGAFWKLKEPRVGPQTSSLQTSENILEAIAKELLIDGSSRADLQINGDRIQLVKLAMDQAPSGDLVEFNYLDRGLFPMPKSPLGMASENYAAERSIQSWMSMNPQKSQALSKHLKPFTTEQALGFPPAILNQRDIDLLSGSDLNLMLWYTPRESGDLRHYLRSILIASVSGYDWDWNIDMENRTGMRPRYGELYQVFKRFGLDLSKLRDYERETIKIGTSAGLLPHSYLDDFYKSYGEKP